MENRKYSHSWIFGCGCITKHIRYTHSEKIYNLAGNKYRLINFIESRYYYISSKKKWCKSHIIHCKSCINDEKMSLVYPSKMEIF